MALNARLLAGLCIILCWVPSAHAADWLYSVRPGDTLWDLCLQYTHRVNCWQELGKRNNVVYPRRLPPGYIIRFPPQWLKQVPRPVVVRFVRGTIWVKNTDAAKLKTGDRLPIGTVLDSDDGVASLEFADGSLMLINPGSQLSLDALSVADGNAIVDSRLRLMRGTAKAQVPKREPRSRFMITTPTAVAAVRGTEFRVSNIAAAGGSDQAEHMRVEVYEGIVAITANGNVVEVRAGFGLTVRKGDKPGEPKPLLLAPEFKGNTDTQPSPLTAQWHAVTGAAQYYLEVLKDSNKEEQIAALSLQAGTEIWQQHRFEQLREGCYQLRVSAIDPFDWQGLPAQQRVCVTQPQPKSKIDQAAKSFIEFMFAVIIALAIF
jgi:hypothetical protein